MKKISFIILSAALAISASAQTLDRSALKKAEWEEYLGKSYELVKSKLTKKQQKGIEEM